MPPVGRLLGGLDIKGIRVDVETVTYSIEKWELRERYRTHVRDYSTQNCAVLKVYYSQPNLTSE